MLKIIIILLVIIIVCFFLKSFRRSIYFICSLDIMLRLLNAISSFYGKYLGNFSSFVNKYIPASLPSIIKEYTSSTLLLILMGVYIIMFVIFEYYILKYMLKNKR